MRLLGIDPAIAATGFALVWMNPDDPSDLVLEDCGIFTTPAKTRGTDRQAAIRHWFKAYLDSRQPVAVALERPYLNGKTAYNSMGLARAYTEITNCCREAFVHLHEYAPNTIKLCAAGSGKAGKPEVRAAMKARFGEALKGRDDKFDAMAVVVTHARKMQEEWEWAKK